MAPLPTYRRLALAAVPVVVAAAWLFTAFVSQAEDVSKAISFTPYSPGSAPGKYVVSDSEPVFSNDGAFVAYRRVYSGRRREGIWIRGEAPDGEVFCAPLADERNSTLRDFSWQAGLYLVADTGDGAFVYPYYYGRGSDGALLYAWVQIKPSVVDGMCAGLDAVEREALRTSMVFAPGRAGPAYRGAESLVAATDGKQYVAYSRDGGLLLRRQLHDPPSRESEPMWADPEAVTLASVDVLWPRWAAGIDGAGPSVMFQTRDRDADDEFLGNTDLFIVRDVPLSGGPADAVPLVKTDATESAPSWSPDAKWIAYYEAHSMGSAYRWHLYVRDAAGSGNSILVEQNVHRSRNGRGPTWARNVPPLWPTDEDPKAQWLVYGADANRSVHVARVDSDGVMVTALGGDSGEGLVGDGDIRTVTDTDAFLPDGDALTLRVAYAARIGTGPSVIYVDDWQWTGDGWGLSGSSEQPDAGDR